MYQEYAEQMLRLAVLTTLVLIIAVGLEQATFAHRLIGMVNAADSTARSTIVSTASAAVLAANNPQAALPNAISTTAPACPVTSTDPYCTDTIQITATLEGGTGVAGSTSQTMPNYNRGTGYNYSSGTGGTPVQGHGVYLYDLNVLNSKNTVIAKHRGIIGLTLINSTTSPVIVDAVADPGGNGLNGYDHQSSTGACAPGGDCSGAAQPTPQPGVSVSDTRIHAELGTCSNPSAPRLCSPTGQTTPTPVPRDVFQDTNVTNNQNTGGWPQ